jgi:hypothetical protein
VEALVAIGQPAVPMLAAELRALTAREDLAHDGIAGLLRALAALGPDAAAAEPALWEVVGESRLRPHAETAWWALGRILGHTGRLSVPIHESTRAVEAARHVTAQIVLARLEAGRLDARTVQSMLERGTWLERCVAAAQVSRLLGSAPDLEATLRRVFHADFDRRRDLRPFENWALQEVADAVAELPGRDDAKVRVQLVRLRHVDARERRLAAMALGSFGPLVQPFVDDLAQALDDPVADVVREVALTLGSVGPVATAAGPALQDITQHARADVARAARTTLARLALQVASAGTDPAVRAVETFLRTPAAERADLVTHLPATAAAAESLVLAYGSLAGGDSALRRDVLLALRAMAPAAVDQVPKLLQLVSAATAEDSELLISVLGAMGAAAASVPDLRARLEWAAATSMFPPLEAMSAALADILVAPVADAKRLVSFLADANPILRLRAAQTLATLRDLDEAARSALAGAIAADHPTDVVLIGDRRLECRALAGDEIQLAAARALFGSSAASPEQVRAAAAQLLDGEPADRVVALQRLPTSLGLGGALPGVVACLRSADDAVALAAIAALTRSGREAAPALPKLRDLTVGEGEVAAAAAAAVRAIAGN